MNQRDVNDVKRYHPLRDVMFWYYGEEQLSFMPHEVPSYCSTENQEPNVYDCGMTISRCSIKYSGDYRCSVYDFVSSSEVEQDVQLNIIDDANKTCYMPIAENITAELIRGENGLHEINVTWEYAEKPKGLKYCEMSRQWQIKVFNSSRSYYFIDGREPTASQFTSVPFQDTLHRRDTYFVFQINDTELSNNYFQFQIQNRRRKGTTDVYLFVRYNSSVFTFKEQSELPFQNVCECV